jgi:hypothetical protein
MHVRVHSKQEFTSTFTFSRNVKAYRNFRITALLQAFILSLCLAQFGAPRMSGQSFTATGLQTEHRSYHTATPLNDGRRLHSPLPASWPVRITDTPRRC